MSDAFRILFVDDEPNVLHGYQRQLRKEFSLEIAVGGAAGLKAIKETGPYAVVVTDMRMPAMNGIEFFCRLKRESLVRGLNKYKP